MSETPAQPATDPAAEPGLARRVLRFILLMLFFVAAGPPVGSVVLFTVIAIGSIASVSDAVYALAAPFMGLLFSPFSYLFGTLPAAVGGVGVAAWQAFRGPVSPIAIALLATLMGLGLAAVSQEILSPEFKRVDWPAAISMFLTAMLPTLICWYPMRKRYYPPPGSGSRPAEGTT